MEIRENQHRAEKGQFQQVLAFIMLAALAIAFIVFSWIANAILFPSSLEQVVRFKEEEDLRAGANALFYSTDPVSGKSVIELVGIAAFHGTDEINFGPVVGKVNVKRDIEAKMDAMFGRDSLGRPKWYIEIPIPQRAADIQVAVVSDTSASMCDDLVSIRDKVPILLKKLLQSGRKVDMTVYMLPGGSCCVVNRTKINLRPDMFPGQTDNFRAMGLSHLKCEEIPGVTLVSDQGNEMWADGTACVAIRGPFGGWKQGAVKIIMPLSDELPGGSEVTDCGGGSGTMADRYERLKVAIKYTKENNVTVFPLKAESCGVITKCDDIPYNLAGTLYCACSPNVENFMRELAKETDGQMFLLDKTGNAAEQIEKILSNVNAERLPAIVAGTKLHIPKSENKKIHAFDFRVPVAFSGEFTIAHVYKW